MIKVKVKVNVKAKVRMMFLVLYLSLLCLLMVKLNHCVQLINILSFKNLDIEEAQFTLHVELDEEVDNQAQLC